MTACPYCRHARRLERDERLVKLGLDEVQEAMRWVTPDERIENRIKTIASRLRRRGAITEEQYRVTLGLPPEAEAPAVDSTLLAPPAPSTPFDTLAVPPFEDQPPPLEPSPLAPDSGTVDTLEILR